MAKPKYNPHEMMILEQESKPLLPRPYHPLKQMSVSISIKDEPLPTDKRRRPWPDIRKSGLKVKTKGEYLMAIIEAAQKRAAIDFMQTAGISLFQEGISSARKTATEKIKCR